MITTMHMVMITTITVGVVAFFAVMTAVTSAPSWTPWRPPSKVVSELYERGQDTVTGLVGGLVGDLMDKIGLGFLTFWT